MRRQKEGHEGHRLNHKEWKQTPRHLMQTLQRRLSHSNERQER